MNEKKFITNYKIIVDFGKEEMNKLKYEITRGQRHFGFISNTKPTLSLIAEITQLLSCSNVNEYLLILI
jgi:hypothetical protein